MISQSKVLKLQNSMHSVVEKLQSVRFALGGSGEKKIYSRLLDAVLIIQECSRDLEGVKTVTRRKPY